MRVSDGRVLGFGQAAILLGSRDPGAIPRLPTASRAGTRELIIFTRIANNAADLSLNAEIWELRHCGSEDSIVRRQLQ